MVAVQEFSGLDFDNINQDQIDLPFLEAIEGFDEPFTFPENFFNRLENLHPKAAFVPSLEDSVFETPLSHAMWTNNFWDTSNKSFPE
jgi:hypothetical protein